MSEPTPIEYLPPTIVDLGDLVELTAQKGGALCDGLLGTDTPFGVCS